MEEYKSVEQLFAGLGGFLSFIETKKYQVFSEHPNMQLGAIELADYTIHIKRIGNHIYGFKAEDALPIVTSYIRRIEGILPNLEPVKFEIEETAKGFREVPISEK